MGLLILTVKSYFETLPYPIVIQESILSSMISMHIRLRVLSMLKTYRRMDHSGCTGETIIGWSQG